MSARCSRAVNISWGELLVGSPSLHLSLATFSSPHFP